MNTQAKKMNEGDEETLLNRFYEVVDLNPLWQISDHILKNLSDLLGHGMKSGFTNLLCDEDQKRWSSLKTLVENEITARRNWPKHNDEVLDLTVSTRKPILDLIKDHGRPISGIKGDENALLLDKAITLVRLISVALALKVDGYVLAKDELRKISGQLNKSIQNVFHKEILINLLKEVDEQHSQNTSLSDHAKVAESFIRTKYKSNDGRRKFLSTYRDAVYRLCGLTPKKGRKESGGEGGSRGKEASRENVRVRRYVDPYTDDDYPPPVEFVSVGKGIDTVPYLGVIEGGDDIEHSNLSYGTSEGKANVASNFWIANYAESLPWNNYGFNCVSRKILASHIKSNDTQYSLILGLMLATGMPFRQVMAFEVGTHGVNIRSTGEYVRNYRTPSNSHVPDKETYLLSKSADTFTVVLPKFINERLQCLGIEEHDNVLLGSIIEMEQNEIKSQCSKVIETLIKQGANGLSLDRIQLSLRKLLAEITGDDVAGYILCSKENEEAPISCYYAAISVRNLEELYAEAIQVLFDE